MLRSGFTHPWVKQFHFSCRDGSCATPHSMLLQGSGTFFDPRDNFLFLVEAFFQNVINYIIMYRLFNYYLYFLNNVLIMVTLLGPWKLKYTNMQKIVTNCAELFFLCRVLALSSTNKLESEFISSTHQWFAVTRDSREQHWTRTERFGRYIKKVLLLLLF